MARRGFSVIGLSPAGRLVFPMASLHLPRSITVLSLFLGIFLPESLTLSIHFLGLTTPFWMTNAVAVTALVRGKRPTWPSLVLLQVAADSLANGIFGQGYAIGLGTAACDAFESVTVAVLLCWIGRETPFLSNLTQIYRGACVCIVVPAFSAVGGAALLGYSLALPFVASWTYWFLSGVFGLLIVLPFLLMWTDADQAVQISWRMKLEVIFLAAVVGMVSVIDFSVPALPGMFLCFPFLLLAAFRGGLLGATTSAVVRTVAASWLTLCGLGPIATNVTITESEKVLLLQLYLTVVLLSSLPVAVMLEQRKLLSQFETLSELSRMARHDSLTGLPNRLLFRERLVCEKGRALREGGRSALLMLDLDRFKPVNDLHGHAAGDRLLEMVAERLLATVRETDTVARLGGDEFAIICPVAEPKIAWRLSERVIEELRKPFEFVDLTVQIGCSVGIALSSAAGRDMDTLMQRADAALYRAKDEGRNCARFSRPTMDHAAQARPEHVVKMIAAVACETGDADDPCGTRHRDTYFSRVVDEIAL